MRLERRGAWFEFEFFGDPLKNKILVLVLYHEGWYKLLLYKGDFSENYRLQRVTSPWLVSEAASKSPLVELRVIFPKDAISPEDKELMRKFDSLSNKRWEAASGLTLMSDSVGIINLTTTK